MIRLICKSFLSGAIPLTITLLSRVIHVISDHIIAQSYAGFRNMAYARVRFDSLPMCLYACAIFLRIAECMSSFEVLAPVVTFLDPEVPSSDALDDASFRFPSHRFSRGADRRRSPVFQPRDG
jgi:hypothetical protein